MLLISIAKALIEMAGMCVVAHILVGLFSPSTRHNNPIYRLFGVVVQPVYSIVRRLLPSVVIDQHIPLASVFTLGLLWVLVVYFKTQAAGISV